MTTIMLQKKKSWHIARFESWKVSWSIMWAKIKKKSVFEKAMEDYHNGDVYGIEDLTLLMTQRWITLSN